MTTGSPSDADLTSEALLEIRDRIDRFNVSGQAKLGEPHAAMFEGTLGHVCVFPVEQTVLLVVFGRQGTTMGMFNVAARQALAELQQAIVRQRERSLRATSAVPAEQQSSVEAWGSSHQGERGTDRGVR